MSLAHLVPVAARLQLRVLRQSVGDALRSARADARPVSAARHTDDELRELARAARAHSLRADVRDLTVTAVERTTTDSATIRFLNPQDDPIRFRPGQFLTFDLEVDGIHHRRSYSFCSDPDDAAEVAVTVRAVPGGAVSQHLVDTVAPGQRFRTVGPSGRFGTDTHPDRARRIVLVAGGAGITPLWSIAQAVVRHEPRSTVELVYANRGASRVILRDAIAALTASGDRLTVTHVLERPSAAFPALRGRLTGDVLERAVPVDAAAEYYVCGPAPMMDAVTAYLRGRGVPDERIATESFCPAGAESVDDDGVYEVRFARSGRVLDVSGRETLLEAGRAAGIDLASSCAMGGCAACRIPLRSGEVFMSQPNCLTPAEAARGDILACVARPRSPLVIDA